jgi:hypothetical protein
MMPSMFGRRSSLRVRLVDHRLPFVFCLAGCLLFSLSLRFWPLFGGWWDGVLALAFIPNPVNVLVLIVLFRLPAFLLAGTYIPRG